MRRSVASFSLCGLLLCCPTLVLGQAATPAPATAPAVTESLTGSFASRLAEQTVKVSQKLDEVLGDMQKKLGDDAKTWPEKVDATAAAKVKVTLSKDWNDQADAIAEALGGQLLSGDDTILKETGLSPDLEGTLGRELRSSRESIIESVKNSLGEGDKAFSSLKTDQVRKDAVKSVDDAFGEAKKVVLKGISKELKDRIQKLVPLLANSTAAASAQARLSENQAKEIEKDEFLKQYSSDTGLSKVVRCSWTDAEHRLLCLPQGLLLAADDVSEIRIQDLPPGKMVRVRALSVAASAAHQSTGSANTTNAAPKQGSDKDREADCIEGSAQARLSCDQMTFDTKAQRSVAISVIKDRYFAPSYGGFKSNLDEALKVLRGNGEQRPKLSLLVSGRTPEILIDIQVEGETASPETVRSTAIPVAYKQWSFETGAFFAFTNVTDEELVTKPVAAATGAPATAPAQVMVTKKINSDTYSQETGIFLSVFSRDYPKVGFGLGFHTSSGRAPSVYLGPTLRLRGLGEHALVTASMGLSVLPVRRFPGVQIGDAYDTNSTTLAGKVVFKGGYYALINLGFSFGPIDNGDSKGK
jgi:hypothetical protein